MSAVAAVAPRIPSRASAGDEPPLSLISARISASVPPRSMLPRSRLSGTSASATTGFGVPVWAVGKGALFGPPCSCSGLFCLGCIPPHDAKSSARRSRALGSGCSPPALARTLISFVGFGQPSCPSRGGRSFPWRKLTAREGEGRRSSTYSIQNKSPNHKMSWGKA